MPNPIRGFILINLSCILMMPSLLAQKKELTWKDRNFFQTLGGTILMERMSPGARLTYVQRPNSVIPGDTVADYGDEEFALTILGITYDPRINLVHYRDKASLSFNVPLEFAINMYGSGGNLTFVLPAFIDVNLFDHSTYNNIDLWGLNFGAGYQFVDGPLAGYSAIKKSWTTPVFRFGIKGPVRKHNCFVNATFMIPHKLYDEYHGVYVHDHGYFKLAAGFILHYD